MLDRTMSYGIMPDYELLFESGNILDIYNIKSQSIELKFNLKGAESIRVFKMLDGTKSLSECLKGASAETAANVCIVLEKYLGKIFYAHSSGKEDYLSRHSKNFLLNNSESFKIHPFQMRSVLSREIAESRIVICGCGILGMEIYDQLISTGVRDIVFADAKDVTSDDVHYSSYYDKEDLFKRRIDVLRNKFKGSENSEFDFYDNVEAAFSREKRGKKVLAVVCEDVITTERLLQLNVFFNRKGIRWVNIYVDSEKISVGPFVIPGVTSCIECHCDRSAFEFPLYYGFNCTDITSNRLAASVFANELFFIAGNICEYLIKDVSLTLCRQFIIKKRDFIVYQNEIVIDCSCTCHRSEV